MQAPHEVICGGYKLLYEALKVQRDVDKINHDVPYADGEDFKVIHRRYAHLSIFSADLISELKAHALRLRGEALAAIEGEGECLV